MDLHEFVSDESAFPRATGSVFRRVGPVVLPGGGHKPFGISVLLAGQTMGQAEEAVGSPGRCPGVDQGKGPRMEPDCVAVVCSIDELVQRTQRPGLVLCGNSIQRESRQIGLSCDRISIGPFPHFPMLERDLANGAEHGLGHGRRRRERRNARRKAWRRGMRLTPGDVGAASGGQEPGAGHF